jgi:hypothetical protein
MRGVEMFAEAKNHSLAASVTLFPAGVNVDTVNFHVVDGSFQSFSPG